MPRLLITTPNQNSVLCTLTTGSCMIWAAAQLQNWNMYSVQCMLVSSSWSFSIPPVLVQSFLFSYNLQEAYPLGVKHTLVSPPSSTSLYNEKCKCPLTQENVKRWSVEYYTSSNKINLYFLSISPLLPLPSLPFSLCYHWDCTGLFSFVEVITYLSNITQAIVKVVFEMGCITASLLLCFLSTNFSDFDNSNNLLSYPIC